MFKWGFCVLLFMLIANTMVKAKAKKYPDDDDVTFTATPARQHALFKSGEAVTYNVIINNPLGTTQTGKVTYRVTTTLGKFLTEDSVKVAIGSNGNKHLQLNMPAEPAGFYKVSLMINVNDYDDTLRRAFGVDPENIRSVYNKPADFEQFWQKTKDELAKIPPNFRMTEMPDSEQDNRKLYLIEMQSLGNITVRAWLTVPISKDKNKKFAVTLGLPGYQVNLRPGFGDNPDMAILYLNVRGQGNSKDVISTRRSAFIYYNIDHRDTYIMRGVIMDCIRAVDFIYSRPELDKSKIIVTGGSMGGYLAIATAGLDKRVTLFSATNPILSDIRNLPLNDWPMNDIKRYTQIRPALTFDKVLNNLDYYDAKNFASDISSPVLMGIGLLDHLAPPPNEYVLFNSIPKNKKIMVYENLAHEVSVDYVMYQGRWSRDAFGLF